MDTGSKSGGEIRIRRERIDGLSRGEMRPWRRGLQVVFQDPYSSLNPRKRIRHALAQPLLNHRICTEGESYLLREPIGHLEEKLDPQLFLRVHRSSIVNLQFVKEVRTESTGESVVILLNGQRLSMSRTYRSRINEWLTHG